MTVTDLKKMLTAGRHAHLIGIGGVSMFPLAELLKVRGPGHHRLGRPQKPQR